MKKQGKIPNTVAEFIGWLTRASNGQMGSMQLRAQFRGHTGHPVPCDWCAEWPRTPQESETMFLTFYPRDGQYREEGIPSDLQDIFESVEALTVGEFFKFIKLLKEKFGSLDAINEGIEPPKFDAIEEP